MIIIVDRVVKLINPSKVEVYFTNKLDKKSRYKVIGLKDLVIGILELISRVEMQFWFLQIIIMKFCLNIVLKIGFCEVLNNEYLVFSDNLKIILTIEGF